MGRRARGGRAGFTLTELMITVAIFGIMSAVAMPLLGRALERYRLGMAIREVERELQTARVKAVAANRPIQVLFDCPVAGQFRRVEVLSEPGVPDARDNQLTRCDATTFPYPAADTDPVTRPNNDGPLHYLVPGIAFTGVSGIEFHSDGTAFSDAAGGTIAWSTIPVAGVSVTLTKDGVNRTILVNGMGRVFLQP